YNERTVRIPVNRGYGTGNWQLATGNYLPNLTATFCPAITRPPAAGDCSRATPLPITSTSIPDCWASSTTERNGLPKNDGTTCPPLTSRTTAPLAAAGGTTTGIAAAGVLVAGPLAAATLLLPASAARVAGELRRSATGAITGELDFK